MELEVGMGDADGVRGGEGDDSSSVKTMAKCEGDDRNVRTETTAQERQ